MNVVYLTACAFMLHFLNDIAIDAELTKKINHYAIFASLKSESTW